jgi:sec-independent protein translocase protein TatA
MGNLTGWHLLIIVAVVVLLFGAAKLPALAKSVGQSTRIFKAEMKNMNADAAETSEPPSVSGVASPEPTTKL